MKEIYWLQVLCDAGVIFTIVFVILAIAVALLTIGAVGNYIADYEEDSVKCRKALKHLLIPFFIFMAGTIFIPSEKEMYIILGIGGTLDYIQSNEKVQELPDKVVDALTRYVDSIEKE